MSEELQIPAKYHQSFIGAGGKLIQSIMEDCGGVQIKFPVAESGSDKVCYRVRFFCCFICNFHCSTVGNF